MKNKKNFIIEVPIYDKHIMVSIAQSPEELQLCLNMYGVNKIDYILPEFTLGHTMILDNYAILIIINKSIKEYGEFQGIIAHEIFHAAFFILNECNVLFDLLTNDEVYAYLVGFITKEFYIKYNTNHNEKK